MTSAATSPCTREMLAQAFERGRNRPIVLRLEAGTVRCRLKGTRREYVIDARSVFFAAMRAHCAEQKRLKKLEREQRRKERSG